MKRLQFAERLGTDRAIGFGLLLFTLVTLTGGCATIRRSISSESPAAEMKVSQQPMETASGDALEAKIAFETAQLAVERGMDAEAISGFEKARRLQPNMRGISHPLAVLYDRAGRVDAAEREYQLALAENGREASVYCDYGYFLYSTGQLEAAESTLRKAIELAPKDKQSRVNLGLVLGTKGQYEEAERWFTEAIGPAAAQHNIGMLKLRQGDTVSARVHLEQASRRDPSLQQSQIVLANLDGPLKYR